MNPQMDFGVDDAGKNVIPLGVNHLLRLRQRIVSSDSDELGVSDSDAPFDDPLR